MPFDRRRRQLSSTATQITRSAIRRNTVTGLKTTTSLTIFASTSLSSTSESRSGASSSASPRPIVTAGSATRGNVIVAVVLAGVFVLALAATFKLHYAWRRRAARRRNSNFIQYPFYTDAAPGRMSVVPRDEPLVPPPGPRDWDARSAAASSTAATFDSPIGASEFHHGHGRGVQSLDEKLRDIFYPAAHADPRSSASLVPSFSSPASVSTPPISPLPPAAHAQLPSFVPAGVARPPAEPKVSRGTPGHPSSNFPVSQLPLETGFNPRTLEYGGRGGGGGGRRPPSYIHNRR